MRTVNKFIFTGLFFVLAVCAFAQAQDSIVHADTTVITAQDVTVAPPDSLKAADSLQVMTDTVPPKKTKVYLIHSHPNWCSTQMHFNPAFISPDLHFCKSRVDSFCSVFVCIYICNKTFDSCHRMLPAFILLLLYIFIGRL